MLHLLLIDAELELVPQRVTGHQQVVQAARRVGVSPAKMLLDSSLHYAAMRDLPEGERRGRPDLVHLFLLTALESIPNKLGQLRVWVHTRNDELISVAPETRIVRNCVRFSGLIQQLFERGAVGEPEPLLRIERSRKVASVVAQLKPDRILVLDPKGSAMQPSNLFENGDEARTIVAVIGGFPSGDYRSELPNDAGRVSIHEDPLTVWTVASELLAHYPRSGASLTRK